MKPISDRALKPIAKSKAKPVPNRLTSSMYMSASDSLRVFFETHHGSISMHWHDFYEMTYIVSGEARHNLNGTISKLGAGTVFLLTPADFHELIFEHGEQLVLINVIFAPDMLEDAIGDFLFPDPHAGAIILRLDDQAIPAIDSDFRRLWTEYTEQAPGAGMLIQATLNRLLIELGRQYRQTASRSEPEPPPPGDHMPEKGASPPMQQAVRKALIYMNHHFREPITLAVVARQAGYSEGYFSDCFGRVTGESFQSYLQKLRLQFAQKMLLASGMSVTEVCYCSGFNTLNHFERAFKQHFQMSPRAFKASSVKNID
ncbi:AraC family transcriptional regulator [Paenibacillaceae bacterium]|nr:AraC family transcriptional regulator [Paenibacillaceae bacterium]